MLTTTSIDGAISIHGTQNLAYRVLPYPRARLTCVCTPGSGPTRREIVVGAPLDIQYQKVVSML